MHIDALYSGICRIQQYASATQICMIVYSIFVDELFSWPRPRLSSFLWLSTHLDLVIPCSSCGTLHCIHCTWMFLIFRTVPWEDHISSFNQGDLCIWSDVHAAFSSILDWYERKGQHVDNILWNVTWQQIAKISPSLAKQAMTWLTVAWNIFHDDLWGTGQTGHLSWLHHLNWGYLEQFWHFSWRSQAQGFTASLHAIPCAQMNINQIIISTSDCNWVLSN